MQKSLNRAFAASVLIVIAFTYWPVIHANFVWDDWLDFHDMPWLRYGDQWKHFVLSGFNDWTNYFRPLVVALFTLQVRLFDGAPGPMHAVSLCMHLINTLLVGTLAQRCHMAMSNGEARTPLFALPMLVYGMHPVLIEPVAWIGCQFELVLTMMVLLALLANLAIRRATVRAAVVATLFLLAACSKESAISLPVLLVIFDWMILSRPPAEPFRITVHSMLTRNWKVYLAVFLAGLIYLVFRHWAIGSIVNPFDAGSGSITARLQEICFIYLEYWKTLLVPMSGMSPIHPGAGLQFHLISAQSLLTDVIATSIIAAGLVLVFKSSSTIGYIIVAVSATLLPVLHIVPLNFDGSLYHERYVMTGLAVACAMLPLMRMPDQTNWKMDRIAIPLKTVAVFVWLAFSFVSIQITLPKWSNNANLWKWALVQNPDSVDAKDGLLSTYVDSKDYVHANELIDRLLLDKVPCTNCMLNAAVLAVAENNPERAAVALEKVRNSRELALDRKMFGVYLLTTGEMLVEQGHLDDAEEVLRAAVEVDILDPRPKVSLAMALAIQGKQGEARKWGESGIALLPLSEQESTRKMLDEAIASRHRSAVEQAIPGKN